MKSMNEHPTCWRPKVIGSFGNLADMIEADAAQISASCDMAEVRLDLLKAEKENVDRSCWNQLEGIPLLFTARRIEEGGGLAMDAAARMEMLTAVLDDAAWIDLEVASISEMSELLSELGRRKIPWIASYHDFKKLPDNAALVHAAKLAKDAGATVFKAATFLKTPADLARLAEFQMADHGLPVATMGMGPLAAVSRLLCAQSGSIFNYGYLGKTATAPGQWDSAFLKSAISRLIPIEN